MSNLPDLQIETHYHQQGYRILAGVDEVGRGALAGPVVTAAVILPAQTELIPSGINDSKKLSSTQRELLNQQLLAVATAYAIGMATPMEIDQLNILQATKLAMCRALQQLQPAPDFVLIDGRDHLDIALPQKSIIAGDSRSLSIAAASIMAKVYRDQLMRNMDRDFPQFGFGVHKGYGTKQHRQAIQQYGACQQHRLSFAGVQ